MPGPRRGFHVPHARDTTGVGALWTPRTMVLAPTEATTGRAPAASQRPVPAPRSSTPPRGASHNEASTRVQAIHPSDLPLTCGRPDGSGQPLGLSLGLRTPPAKSRQRTPRWGQAIEHGPGTTAQLIIIVDLQSSSSLNACDLVSHVAFAIAPVGLAETWKRSRGQLRFRAKRDLSCDSDASHSRSTEADSPRSCRRLSRAVSSRQARPGRSHARE